MLNTNAVADDNKFREKSASTGLLHHVRDAVPFLLEALMFFVNLFSS